MFIFINMMNLCGNKKDKLEQNKNVWGESTTSKVYAGSVVNNSVAFTKLIQF